MKKNEIIQSTLKAMGRWQGPADDPNSPYDNGNPDLYDSIVIRTLQGRLPDVEFQTCTDLAHSEVECCDTCHNYCPHIEMIIEDLPNGGKAWICCAVSRFLHGEQVSSAEEMDLEEALGGGIRKVRDEDEGDPKS